MEGIKEKYKVIKCSKCSNRDAKIESDKCDIRTYHDHEYRYCRCCNMTSDDKEIKEKI
jgi:hypothetical protein